MIVVLAGHVDHGKTSLVKALTGTDTDQLDEERRRGLTIDLGFAYTDLGGSRVGFVDVPGHHRFVHNMVAGVASRQTALLVIAANDGVMPQTREHVGILSLIGVERGVIALTKVDTVGEERLAQVRAEACAFVAGTFLEAAPIVPVSAPSGLGVPELARALTSAAHCGADEDEACFRLAIDRAFNLKGIGLVVTGTVHSGIASVGAELTLAPSGAAVRLRSMRVQDLDAESARAGDRCAVNIVGVDRNEVARGMWLVPPEAFFPTSRIVMRVTVLTDYPRTVRHAMSVHVHHAADQVTGRIALLDSPPIEPGGTARIELITDRPLHPKRGDRIVLRDDARGCTLGGGEVIDIAPPMIGRRKPTRLQRLALSDAHSAQDAFGALLATDEGVAHEPLRQNWNLPRARFDRLLASFALRTVDVRGAATSFAAARVDELEARIQERVGSYHKAAPYSAGLRIDQLQRLLAASPKPMEVALAGLQRAAIVQCTNGYYHLAGHKPRLAPDDAQLLQGLTGLLEAAHPPSIGDAAKALQADLKTLHAFIDRMAGLGLLIRVSSSRCFLPATMDRLIRIVADLSAQPDGFTAAEFRDAAGVGRNLAIDLLEYLDRQGTTRRTGDRRRMARASAPAS